MEQLSELSQLPRELLLKASAPSFLYSHSSCRPAILHAPPQVRLPAGGCNFPIAYVRSPGGMEPYSRSFWLALQQQED